MKNPVFFFAMLAMLPWAAQADYAPAASCDSTDRLGLSTLADPLHYHYPPDPVNMRSGNFHYPVQDLFLPCFGIPLEVYRAYNSFSKKNGPFGIGWTFNYDIKITVGTYGTLKVLEYDGFLNEYAPKGGPEGNRGELIDRIITAKKDEDKRYMKKERAEDYYDQMRIKLATDDDYFKRLKERYVPVDGKEIPEGEYVGTGRSIYTIKKEKDRFLRTRLSDGIKEYFNLNGDLFLIEDRNGNRLNLYYDANKRLVKVADGCTHYILLNYNTRAKISQITDSIGRTVKYSYDALDRITEVKEYDGTITAYGYNSVGFLEKISSARDGSVTISYDANKGTVKEQRGPGNKVTQYAFGLKSPNVRWSSVKDNEGYEMNYEYHLDENKIVERDKAGKQTITILSKTCSKPISVTDPSGSGRFMNYDNDGNLTEKREPKGGTIKYTYDKRFNLPTEVVDDKGNRAKFLYDERSNITSAVVGENWVRLRYEKHGKLESMMDNLGNMISLRYAYFGMPSVIEKKFKGKFISSLTMKYDAAGKISSVKYSPNNPSVANDIKKTMNSMLELLKPAGIDLKI